MTVAARLRGGAWVADAPGPGLRSHTASARATAVASRQLPSRYTPSPP
ncbi:hypothetical protein Q604_UNBC03181G0002, partial [human gut metagenome]